MRARPRGVPAGVRAHQPDAELRSHLGEQRVDAAPGVVDQVSTGLAADPADLVPPGVDADHQVRETGAHLGDHAALSAGSPRRVHVLTGAGLDPADVHQVGALLDGPATASSAAAPQRSRPRHRTSPGTVHDGHQRCARPGTPAPEAQRHDVPSSTPSPWWARRGTILPWSSSSCSPVSRFSAPSPSWHPAVVTGWSRSPPTALGPGRRPIERSAAMTCAGPFRRGVPGLWDRARWTSSSTGWR